MKSPMKEKLPENLKKIPAPTAISLFSAKKKIEDGIGKAADSATSSPATSDGSGGSASKLKKRRSIGLKKSALSNSLKKSASLEKSMRGHTLAVNNRSLANQVQGLKTQLRMAQEENVEKSRQVNELTARVRRLEVIDDQERFELLLQERLKQELALLADLVRETVMGLSRSAEKLNSVLTISQRMQASNAEQGRSLLAPRPRITLTSPQERATRLSALFDQSETQPSLCGPTIRKKSGVPAVECRKTSLQEEMRIDEENEAESADTEDTLRKKAEEVPAATSPAVLLPVIDEATEESPFAKKDKVPRTPLSKGPAKPSIWESDSPSRRKTASPPRPLRPMSPALMQKMYKRQTSINNNELKSPLATNDSDQVVAETPMSVRGRRSSQTGDDDTLTERVAEPQQNAPIPPPALNDDDEDDDEEEEVNESSFVSIRSRARNRRRNISTDGDDDDEEEDESPRKRAMVCEPPTKVKEVSPPKKSRIDRRDTFVVSRPAVFSRPPLVGPGDLPPLSSTSLPSRFSSPRMSGGRRLTRTSSTDQEDTPKASTTITPQAAAVSSKARTSDSSPPTTAVKVTVNGATERKSPRFFKRAEVDDEEMDSSVAAEVQPSSDIFDLSLMSTGDSPQMDAVGKKASKKAKKSSRAIRSKTPMIDSPAKEEKKTQSVKNRRKSNGGLSVAAEGERLKTPVIAESSINSTFSVTTDRGAPQARRKLRSRTPVPVDDHDESANNNESLNQAKPSEPAEAEPNRGRSRRNAALKVTSFKEASLNSKMRRDQ